VSKYLKNTKNLKIYWSISPKHGFSASTMKHTGFNITIKENRSLLEGEDKASVTQIFSYQEPQQKNYITSDDMAESEYRHKNFVRTLFAEQVVEGKPDAVYAEMILKLGASKDEFKKDWKRAKYRDFLKRSSNRARYYNPFSLGTPAGKIAEQLREQNLSISQIADRLKQTNKKVNYENIVNEVRGNRKIPIDRIDEYSKVLGVDPAELVFEDLRTHIWGKVDLLKNNELEDLYSPGRIFTYYTKLDDAQIVTVPRNIWRSDIMAIKVASAASMFNNQVAFYYKSREWSRAIPNRLCVMAVRVQMEELGIDQTEYYFGIYEELKGKVNLVNPDPNRPREYILQNCQPEWTAPIVAMINPGLVKKSKITSDIIKDHSSIQNKHVEDEKYKILIERVKADVMKTHDQAKKMNAKLRTTLDAVKKWQDDEKVINDKLFPEIFRSSEEELKLLKDKILNTVEEHFDDEDKVA